jgi:methylated-DNA-[protein]-cysteine S-methyltransferase
VKIDLWTYGDSPIGPLGLATDEAGVVVGCSFEGVGDLERVMRRVWPGAHISPGEAPASVIEALDAYFSGQRDALDRVNWRVPGDDFQARVWRALADIPPGVTIAYGEMARRAGEPGAAQAAGVALNRNPIPLILACHRVVGHDGSLVGFGGGVERKSWLLAHEGALLI